VAVNRVVTEAVVSAMDVCTCVSADWDSLVGSVRTVSIFAMFA
jgi:hypothetical protein